LKNKEELIRDFEVAADNNQESLENPIEFYSDIGLISCLEKTDDSKFLVLGTENLSIVNKTKISLVFLDLYIIKLTNKKCNYLLLILGILVLEINSENKSNIDKKHPNLNILDNLSLVKQTKNTSKSKKDHNNTPAANSESIEVNSILALKVISNCYSCSESKSENIKIIVGMYSSKIAILIFDSNSNKLEFSYEIKNACDIQKPGISSFDFIQFEAKIKNELKEMEYGLLGAVNEKDKDDKLLSANIETCSDAIEDTKKINFLCFCGYDSKIRLYEYFEHNHDPFEYLGGLYNGADCIIHKVKFFRDRETGSSEDKRDDLYLFVAADQKIFNIYNIA